MTIEELRRRRARREAWHQQDGRCVHCDRELDDDEAVLDGVIYAGDWMLQELRCVDCAAGEVVWALDLELARAAASTQQLSRR